MKKVIMVVLLLLSVSSWASETNQCAQDAVDEHGAYTLISINDVDSFIDDKNDRMLCMSFGVGYIHSFALMNTLMHQCNPSDLAKATMNKVKKTNELWEMFCTDDEFLNGEPTPGWEDIAPHLLKLESQYEQVLEEFGVDSPMDEF